jgi:hypothetical protein
VKDFSSIVHALGQGQHSVVTWRQLRRAGVTEDWIDRQVHAGRLIREAPNVYRPWAVRRSWQMRATAAVLSARAPALVSHRSAAYLWGVDEHMPGIIDITVPRHRRPRARIGVQFHESRAFELAEPAIRNAIPTTGMARTLLDCCAVIDSPVARLELLDEADRLKLTTWDDLWACLLAHAGRGRRGWAAFRDVLVRRDGQTPPGTKFAGRVGLLLESAGLPTPVYEYPVLDYRLDLAWPDRKVAVECLGKIGHDFERAFENDPIRRNRIVLAGWFVLEVTWQRFIGDPQAFVTEIRQGLGGG